MKTFIIHVLLMAAMQQSEVITVKHRRAAAVAAPIQHNVFVAQSGNVFVAKSGNVFVGQ